MTHYDPTISSGYLNSAFSPKSLPEIVNQIVKFLGRPYRRKTFDSIVVRGVSGMLVGSPVAYRMKLPLVVVRKSDGNHSGQSVEGYTYVKNYVVIDDFVSSGDTINEIRAKMQGYNSAKMTGLVVYAAYGTNVYQAHSNCWNSWIKKVGVENNFFKPKK